MEFTRPETARGQKIAKEDGVEAERVVKIGGGE